MPHILQPHFARLQLIRTAHGYVPAGLCKLYTHLRARGQMTQIETSKHIGVQLGLPMEKLDEKPPAL